MKKNVILCFGTISIIFCIINPAESGEWRHSIGFSYIQSLSDFMDVMENNEKVKGYEVDTHEWPVGISFNPYYQWDNGLGLGIGIGPLQFILKDVSDDIFINLSISADIRYNFFKESKISPYVRTGLSYNIVGSDYVDSSKPGFFGGVGIEFLRKSIVGFGFEIAYYASEIEMKKYSGNEWSYRLDGTEKISPEIIASVFIILY